MIKKKNSGHRDFLYFAFMSWQRAIRDKQFKLIEYCVNGNRHTQLFDLSTDPDEMKNLAGNPEYEAKLNGMRSLLESERVKQNDGNTPFEFTDEQGRSFWSTFKNNETTEYPDFNF